VIIAPLVFSTMVARITSLGDAKAWGKMDLLPGVRLDPPMSPRLEKSFRVLGLLTG
jgi:hypothetical protein